MAVLDAVACSSTPVAHLAVVFAPCMDGPIANSYLSLVTSFAFEIRGCMHIAVDTTMNVGYGISSGKTVRASVHG